MYPLYIVLEENDYNRLISSFTPAIHNPMSSVMEPVRSSSTWITAAASRSCACIARTNMISKRKSDQDVSLYRLLE